MKSKGYGFRRNPFPFAFQVSRKEARKTPVSGLMQASFRVAN